MDKTRKVLLLEDHEESRVALSSFLQKDGLTVDQAGSIREAIAKLDRQDAVILDINVPDGNGLELLAHIRREKPHLRVAMLTALTDARKVALASGAEAFFTKPLSSEGLNSLREWAKGKA